MKKSNWWMGCATVALVSVGPAAAQSDDERAPQNVDEIVVQGTIGYRDLSESIAPTLEYDTDYFQRFEPLTAGDALKRVPSVAFVGTDILEADQAQLRGLGAGYTQILINGEQVPGSGDDRTFFLDRIPAELIERVEIIRSSSASRSGDAVAGALNIVLRDGYTLDGGYVRAGAMHYPDGRVRELLGAVYGGEAGPGRFIVGANIQGRRNPKIKESTRLEPNDDGDAFEFDNREYQTDTRNGTDYSVNGSYHVPVFGGDLDLSGYYVHTDRLQDEDSWEYGDETSIDPSDLLTYNINDQDIVQDNYSVLAKFKRDALGGQFKVKLGYAEFKDDIYEFEIESDVEDIADGLDETSIEGESVFENRTDEELTARLAQEWKMDNDLKLEIGVDFKQKKRDTDIRESKAEGTPAFSTLPPFGVEFEDDNYEVSAYEAVLGGVSQIEENRIDPYIQLNGDYGQATKWELGLRYETTDLQIDVAPEAAEENDDESVLSQSNDYGVLLPSAHVKWVLSDMDRFSISVARTMRRPKFSSLSPALLDGELGDNDFIGNPKLDPETAWGLDVGYERSIGEYGVFGINVFYRDIQDLIETYNTGAPSLEALDDYDDDIEDAEEDGLVVGDAGYPVFDPDSYLFSVRNTGDATVWGIEFDLSTPLTAIGLPNTGLFANYSYLDSEVEDEVGKRRINDQAEFVFNGGFIHDMPDLGASFGVTYREQGDAVNRVVAEEVLIQYGPNLEAFVEKRFGEKFTLRLAGQNLLDESKDERFYKFDTLGDQLSGEIGDFDELEYETESAGRVFTLVGRYAF
ncbi:TonB-dependent receptor plug domain-containing protein [Parvularcula sp. LCG005]|uniref:TonB-dependent receptor plug domain-containing protein n=1 Tax=Parvularcula sp. LCG005 TaxID=3078805 RepID=UPI002943CD0A|nr:TonB-dependent receptor [Parvularcula sp. LCG005]WOI53084.1 TonB-dependent receptor [Parvularcula sp. LCG005]